MRGDRLFTMHLKLGNSHPGLSDELYREYEMFADQAVGYDLVTRLRLFSYTAGVVSLHHIPNRLTPLSVHDFIS